MTIRADPGGRGAWARVQQGRRFGPLHFERRARFEVADEDKQSRLCHQNMENDEDGAQASPEPDVGVSTRGSGHMSIRSSQWSFSTISSSTQHSYNACCCGTQHPLIQKNFRVVLASWSARDWRWPPLQVFLAPSSWCRTSYC